MLFTCQHFFWAQLDFDVCRPNIFYFLEGDRSIFAQDTFTGTARNIMTGEDIFRRCALMVAGAVAESFLNGRQNRIRGWSHECMNTKSYFYAYILNSFHQYGCGAKGKDWRIQPWKYWELFVVRLRDIFRIKENVVNWRKMPQIRCMCLN